MAKAAEWRKCFAEHFEDVQVQTMVRAAVVIATLTVDECLEKFDKGREGRGDDVETVFDAVEYFGMGGMGLNS